MTLRRAVLGTCVGFAAAFVCGDWPARAGTAPPLGAAETFVVLAFSDVTNVGASVLTGDVGVSPGNNISGFPPGIVNGAIHPADEVAIAAQLDNIDAFNSLAIQACDIDLSGSDLGGLTLTPANYCFSASAQLTGTLTLDFQGSANAVFVFQIGSTLTTAASSTVTFINGGATCNVFWQVGSSATLGTGTTFRGNVLALTNITFETGADLYGRALSQAGRLGMDAANIDRSTCANSLVVLFDDDFESGNTLEWSDTLP